MKTKASDRERLEKLNRDIDLLDKLRNDLSDIRDEMQTEEGFVPDSYEKKTPEMVRRKLVSETDEDEEDDEETVIVHRSSSHKTANPDEVYKDIMKEDKRRRKMGKD